MVAKTFQVEGSGSGPRAGNPTDHREDIVLADDHVLDPVELDLVARVLADENAVAGLDVHGADLAVLEDLAAAHGDHERLERLLLGRVRDDDPSLGLLFLVQALDDDAI